MEVLLNFVWLLVSAATLVWWVRQQQDSPSWWTLRFEFFGLCCVLALTFPLISATDDLYALGQQIDEPSSIKRLLKQAGQTSPHSSGHGNALPAIPVVAAHFNLPDSDTWISSTNPSVSFLQLASSWRGRAPPLHFSL